MDQSSSGIDRKKWGSSHITNLFTPLHSQVPPHLEPALTTLPTPFKVCIIGASRGIGTGLATAYTQAGATHLLLTSRRVSGLEETARKCHAINPNIHISIHPSDITSPTSIEALASHASTLYAGRIDVVAINSGYSGPVQTSLLTTSPTTFLEAASVNYIGTFHAAKYFLPLLRAGKGSFVAVSSMAGFLVRGPIANTQYCVSKLAQLKVMEHVHEQEGGNGVMSFSVHPGAVASEMALETAPEVFKEFLVDSPELCGAVVVWLTRDREREWLSGRLISANWNLDKLVEMKERIVREDLLKIDLGIPSLD